MNRKPYSIRARPAFTLILLRTRETNTLFHFGKSYLHFFNIFLLYRNAESFLTRSPTKLRSLSRRVNVLCKFVFNFLILCFRNLGACRIGYAIYEIAYNSSRVESSTNIYTLCVADIWKIFRIRLYVYIRAFSFFSQIMYTREYGENDSEQKYMMTRRYTTFITMKWEGLSLIFISSKTKMNSQP